MIAYFISHEEEREREREDTIPSSLLYFYKCFICVYIKRSGWKENDGEERNLCSMCSIVNLILMLERCGERNDIIDIVMADNGWRINIIYTSHLIKLN